MPRASARGIQADGQVRRVTQQARGCGLAGPPFSCTPTTATTRTCRCQTGRLVAASHAYDYGNQMKGGGKAPGCRICLAMVRGWSCGQHVTGDGRVPASLESSGANDHTIWNERRPIWCPGPAMCQLCSASGVVADSSGMPRMAGMRRYEHAVQRSTDTSTRETANYRCIPNDPMFLPGDFSFRQPSDCATFIWL